MMESGLHLTLASVVLRHKLPAAAAPEAVSQLVSDLLVRDLALAEACALSRAGSVALLDLVWARSAREYPPTTFSRARLLRSEPHYRAWAFDQTLQQAARREDLVLVRWTLGHFPGLTISQKVVELAASTGQLGLLQLLDAEPPARAVEWGQASSLLVAARAGHWELARWMLPRCRLSMSCRQHNAELLMCALDHNNLQAFEWAVSKGFSMKHVALADPPVPRRLRAVVEARSLQASRRGPTDTLEKQWADRVPILRYMVELKIVALRDIAAIAWRPAARYGDLPFLKWLAAKLGSRFRGADTATIAEALEAAAEHGHLEVVQWLATNFNVLKESNGPSCAMFAAAESGELGVVRWLYEKYSHEPRVKLFLKHEIYMPDDEDQAAGNQMGGSDTQDSDKIMNPLVLNNQAAFQGTAMDVAAKNGHMGVLQFLQSVATTPNGEDQESGGNGGRDGRGGRAERGGRGGRGGWGGRAGRGGRGAKAKRQRGRRPHCTTAAMDMAAAAGRLSVVQWLHSNRTEGCTKAAMDIAAANGQLEVVKWLHFNRSEGCTKTAIDLAAAKCLSEEPAKHASLDELAQLAPFATPKDERQFEIIKFLHSKRSAGCTSAAMDAAASNGNLPLLKWLHSNMRARCTRQAMDDAAARGRLDIVKWLHQNRKGCTTAAMDWAAAGGHLEVVKWLHQNRREGCTTMAMDQAAANGELEMVQWLCANRSEGCTPDAIEAAARAGDLKMIKLLHSTNPDLLVVGEIEDEILSAAFEDYGVGFADESGEFARIANIEALREAACRGSLNIVQWLVANCDDLDIVRAMEGPIINGHFEVLLYLHSKHVGRPKAYDVKAVWDNLRVYRASQQTPKPNLDKNIVWWFREKYPYPTDPDVARDLMRDSVGLEHELSAHFEAAFARQFLR